MLKFNNKIVWLIVFISFVSKHSAQLLKVIEIDVIDTGILEISFTKPRNEYNLLDFSGVYKTINCTIGPVKIPSVFCESQYLLGNSDEMDKNFQIITPLNMYDIPRPENEQRFLISKTKLQGVYYLILNIARNTTTDDCTFGIMHYYRVHACINATMNSYDKKKSIIS